MRSTAAVSPHGTCKVIKWQTLGNLKSAVTVRFNLSSLCFIRVFCAVHCEAVAICEGRTSAPNVFIHKCLACDFCCVVSISRRIHITLSTATGNK